MHFTHVHYPNFHQLARPGLYLLHSSHGWEGTSDLFDLRIFIASDVDKCIDRLKIRNKCIPGYTERGGDRNKVRCSRQSECNARQADRQ
jgi:pantothenate kinase